MSGFLLDTNVLSELRKARCNAAVAAWSDAQRSEDLFTSVVVFAEIRFGISLVSDRNFRKDLEEWLENDLRSWFANRLLPIDELVLLRWREMIERGRKAGHTFSQPDLFLAAQADLHNLTIVTRNVNDFLAAGVPAFNPWEFNVRSGRG